MRFLQKLCIFIVFWGITLPASGQDLIDRYRKARFQVQVEQYFHKHGLAASPMEIAHIPSRADTVRQWLIQLNRNAQIAAWKKRQKSFEIESWKLVRRLERSWFDKKFENTLWAYLGTEALLPVDTTFTRELRAKLEAYYGPPTQTITELLNNEERSRKRDRYIQFEYWFVVNDSIPLVFMDVNGPLERGLIASTDQQYRDILLSVRESFLKEFMQSDLPAPFVDYYFDAGSSIWYYAGYDGTKYFMQPIGRPNLALGRPWLESLNRSD